jgi:thiol-disulfide isomerase/thioredoxin
MKFLKQCLMTVTLLLSLQTIAQEKPKRLYVGDKVPDIEFNGIYNYHAKKAKLSDFKGKAVILDFWNKGCSSCIAGFPSLQKLQEEFKDDLVILLVNDQPEQTRENLDPLFRNSPILKGTTLPIVLGDATFTNRSELFPHYGVPYHVWIDKSGIIQATTHGTEATFENIKKLIQGEQLNVIKRIDVTERGHRDNRTTWPDINKGLFINNIVYYNSIYGADSDSRRENGLGGRWHSLFMKAPNAGNLVGGGSARISDSTGKMIGVWCRGKVLTHYSTAYEANGLPVVIEENTNLVLNDEFIYEYTHYKFSDSTNGLFLDAYKQDLENYFGYKGTIENKFVETFILFRTNKALKLATKGGVEIYENTMSKKGTVIQNGRFGFLRSHLNWSSNKDRFGNHATVIDETGIDPQTKVDMTLYSDLKNIRELNRSLSKYELGIKKEHRMLPVLVLKKSIKD